MACCCKSGKIHKSSVSCLGRCDLPKHKCLYRRDVKPGPVPPHMGWLYTAKDSPEHQLRCGWRPGHISCTVLRRIEQLNCMKDSDCLPSPCPPPLCQHTCCVPSCSQPAPCPHTSPCTHAPPCADKEGLPTPSIRIIRHAGNYTICTKPSKLNCSPSGPNPLKYVLNDEDDGCPPKNAIYAVEAKFNDYRFDYTASQSSFILDFTPP